MPPKNDDYANPTNREWATLVNRVEYLGIELERQAREMLVFKAKVAVWAGIFGSFAAIIATLLMHYGVKIIQKIP